MRYKVGDKVRARKDLEVKAYKGVNVVDKMKSLANEVLTVSFYNVVSNFIYVEENDFIWSDEMFEPVAFTKQDLQTGDVIQLRKGCLYVFVNKELGFVALTNNTVSDGGDNTARYRFIDDNLKHFQGIKQYDVVKVYRSNSVSLIGFDFVEYDINKCFDLIWQEEKPKTYYTLEEASRTEKRFRHKDCSTYHYNAFSVLTDAITYTSKTMFELMKLKEFEVEE